MVHEVPKGAPDFFGGLTLGDDSLPIPPPDVPELGRIKRLLRVLIQSMAFQKASNLTGRHRVSVIVPV